ncbi:class II glutamine amidotransferase [Georgenia sp. SYP-B2076]|uniref:class II glutamine amidotransferase n=1 Tax=Georgenia sp. SYP-B2076 TaxID=2495881 RepID=UPI000F8C3C70|nr:class II glutamine amidotransferase [Georgenia sp. SYP-B2076]
MAYSGDPVLAEELLFKPEHSLIDQSLNSRLGATTTNGDGFGIGWYGEGEEPSVFKGTDPAWNDRNLREVTRQIRTPMFFAHIRASTGTAVQRSNCHPFRHGHWLWMHNGLVEGFQHLKRDLVVAVDPSLYPDIEGSTDSEVLFFLAITFGLKDDPVSAVERAVRLVEDVAARHGVANPVQMTVATTDGQAMWAFRYSSVGRSRSLYFSTKVSKLLELHPDVEVLHRLGAETRFVVSEPLRDLSGAWNEVPESSCGMVRPGEAEIRPFRPMALTA